MINTLGEKYQQDIKKETNLWNKAAESELKKFPPDYKYYKETLPYKIYRHKYVMKMLSNIKPGDKVLELGCYNGWFSLEMARRGVLVDAHDISPKAIGIAKKYLRRRQKEEKFKGKVNYSVTDLNKVKFPKNTYDKIVIRNVLHHLTNLVSLFIQLRQTLKKGGKILVDDALPCNMPEALISGAFLFLLPTDIPYSQKLRRVFRKRNILKRTQGLVDACGASPFEGVSGDKSVYYLTKNFKLLSYTTFAAFVGTISAHINISNLFKMLLLQLLNFLDVVLTKAKLIQGTGYYLVAKKN